MAKVIQIVFRNSKILANFPIEGKYRKTGHDSLEPSTSGPLEPFLNLTKELLNKG